MESEPEASAGGSDAELITRVRAGDRSAFGTLYSRHAAAATNLARQFARSPSEVDDLVSESFARVLDALLGGRGPDSAFRAYLFTTLRNTAFDRGRKDSRLQFTDDVTVHETPEVTDDPVVLELENTLVARAFAALPERWQTVLWHTQVEEQSPAEVGVLLGMSANAVTSLAFRAREGLREAYLQAHLADTAAERCRSTVDRLGGWARGGLSKRERVQVDAHLAECDRCRALAAELTEINTGLRVLLAPLLLGGAAAGYLAGTGTGVAAPLVVAGAAGAAGTGAAVGAGAAAASGSSGGGVLGFLSRPWTIAAGGAAVAAAVVAAVLVALAGSGGRPPLAGEPPAVTSAAPSTASAAPTTVASDTTAPSATPPPASPTTASTPAAAASSTPAATTTPLPATTLGRFTAPTVVRSTAPAPAPSTPTSGAPTSPPPTTVTAAALSEPAFTVSALTAVAGAPAAVTFAVRNSGGAPSAPQTARLTMPSGVSLTGGSGTVASEAPALRGPSAFSAFSAFAVFPAPAVAPAAGSVDPVTCAGTACRYEVPADSMLTVTLQLAVAPDATPGDITLTVDGRPAGRPLPVSVAPGLTELSLGVPAGWTIGSPAAARLTGRVAPGVTQVGTVALAIRGADVWLAAPAAGGPCLAADDGRTLLCTAPVIAGTVDFGTVTATAVRAGPLSTSAILPGVGGSLALTGPEGQPLTAASPSPLAGSMTLTGPFDGSMVGAPLMQCLQPISAKDRSNCQMHWLGDSTQPPITRTIGIPSGASVVSATLYWAATSPAAGQSLDSISLTVDGSAQPVTGVAAAGGPQTPGVLVTRAADVTSTLDAATTSLPNATSVTVSASGLGASLTQLGQAYPMAAWSLVVLWTTPSAQASTVEVTSPWTESRSTPGGTVTTLAAAGAPIDQLRVSLWAVDDWAVKAVTLGTTGTATTLTAPGQLDGLCSDPQHTDQQQYACGFQIFEPAAGTLADSGDAAVVLTNTVDDAGQPDRLWIGPTLVVRQGP